MELWSIVSLRSPLKLRITSLSCKPLMMGEHKMKQFSFWSSDAVTLYLVGEGCVGVKNAYNESVSNNFYKSISCIEKETLAPDWWVVVPRCISLVHNFAHMCSLGCWCYYSVTKIFKRLEPVFHCLHQLKLLKDSHQHCRPRNKEQKAVGHLCSSNPRQFAMAEAKLRVEIKW